MRYSIELASTQILFLRGDQLSGKSHIKCNKLEWISRINTFEYGRIVLAYLYA